MAIRGVRLAVTSALSIALVTGCGPAQGADSSDSFDFGAASGVSANCAKGVNAEDDEIGRYDINHHGKPERFARFRCQNSNGPVGDQIEVFDGDSDPSHPQRLGSAPLIHQGEGIPYDGCVTFEGSTVYLADRPSKPGPGWRVVRVATWDGSKMQISTPKGMTVPCADPKPAPAKTK